MHTENSAVKNDVNHTLVLIVCGLGMFTDAYDLFIASMAEPFLRSGFHAHSWVMGLMQAIAPLGAAIGAFSVGMLSDKFGRKSLMYVNLVMFIIISILSACSWSLTSFLFFRF